MAFWDTVLISANARLYGRRLIPNIVDENALQQPGRACLSFPVCYTELHHGFQDVNWRCVSTVYFWLDDTDSTSLPMPLIGRHIFLSGESAQVLNSEQ